MTTDEAKEQASDLLADYAEMLARQGNHPDFRATRQRVLELLAAGIMAQSEVSA